MRNSRGNIASFFLGVTSIIFGHQTHFTIRWIAIIFRIFYFELTSKDSQSLNIENKFILFSMVSALHIIYDRTTQIILYTSFSFFAIVPVNFWRWNSNDARESQVVPMSISEKRCPWTTMSTQENLQKKERDSIHLP